MVDVGVSFETNDWKSSLFFTPAIVGTLVYYLGYHKVGIFLWLVSLALFLVAICFGLASIENLSSDGCIACVLLTLLTVCLALIGVCIFLLISNFNKDNDHVNIFRVNQVALTQFALVNASSNTLNYTLEVSLGPDNWKARRVYYSDMKASAYYRGRNFSSLSLFDRAGADAKNLTDYYNLNSGVLRLDFKGQDELKLDGGARKGYRKDSAGRHFSISLTLSYSGFKDGKSTAINATTILSNNTQGLISVKGVDTFELTDVPLTDATNNTTISNNSAGIDELRRRIGSKVYVCLCLLWCFML